MNNARKPISVKKNLPTRNAKKLLCLKIQISIFDNNFKHLTKLGRAQNFH